MKSYKEIEFKYNADSISTLDFISFCENKKEPFTTINVQGFDHFYSKSDDKTSFFRFRTSNKDNQLTYKKKLNHKNVIRTEYNLDLDKEVKKNLIDEFCNNFGYSYTSSIFKNCFIYKYGIYTLVYYICYDFEAKELGRFIEIEMDEDIEWKSDSEALQNLKMIEKLCKSLGLNQNNKIEESLFELYGDIR